MLDETLKPILPHPRSVKYKRARQKAISYQFMKTAIKTICGIIAGFTFGIFLAEFSDRVLGSPIYGFFICPLVFGYIGYRMSDKNRKIGSSVK